MQKIKKIFKLKNGNYVEDWQYSQGQFEIVETDDIYKACNINTQAFDMFFKDKEEYQGERLIVEFNVTIKPFVS